MAAPDKHFIELKDIVEEWKNIEQVKGAVNCKNLKLTIANVKWDNITCLSDPKHVTKSQVTAEYQKKQKDRTAKINIPFKSQTGTHVTIDSGVVQDLHRNFKLPLAGLPQNILDVTGQYLEIDVGVAETDRNTKTLEHFVELSHKLDQTDSNAQTVTQAEIASTTGEYIAYFSGTAQLEGEVLFSDGDSTDQSCIGEVVKCLKPKSKNVDKLCVSKNGMHVEWKIGGNCHFYLGTNVKGAFK